MKIKPNNWDKCLENGLKWEQILLEKIGHIQLNLSIKRVNYTINPEDQKDGIDGYASLKESKIEIKTRSYSSYKYGDILLETKANINSGKLGWFYTTKSDIIAYIWLNELGTNLVDGYLIFISPQLREWFEVSKYKFQIRIASSINHGDIWRTENYAVPINMFPKKTIYHFNPEIDNSSQSNLNSFIQE